MLSSNGHAAHWAFSTLLFPFTKTILAKAVSTVNCNCGYKQLIANAALKFLFNKRTNVFKFGQCKVKV